MAGGSSGPSGSTTTTQNSAPWATQQPYLSAGFQQAANLFNTGGPQYYPGQTYAGLTPAQGGAVSGQEDLGLSGSPITYAANNASLGILDPSFLNSNPGNKAYEDILNGTGANVQSTISNVLPGLLDTFTGGNRLNSPGAAYGVAQGLGSAIGAQQLGAAQGLSQNYSTAAGQQNTATAVAPSTQGLAYTDLANAFNAGGSQQTDAQNQINAAMQQYNYNQTQPFNLLDWYNGATGGSYGGTSSLTSPYFTQGSGGIGGALSTGTSALGLLSALGAFA